MALRHDELDRVDQGDLLDFLQVCPDAERAVHQLPARETRDGTVDVGRDRDLVERCQAGDRQAFDELYIRYHRRLHRYCVQRVGETHDAEDVVQEAFIRAWRALPRFAGERRFYPWLTVIAANLCVDTLRRRARQTPVEESRIVAFDTGCYDTEDSVLHADDSKTVAVAFGQLSTRHQRVLQMREGSDWSYRQIAEHEGLGITAVETLLWRARQALKREFLLLDEQRGKVGALIGFLVVLPAHLVARLPKAMKQVSSGVGRASSSVRHALGSPGWFGSGALSNAGASTALGVVGPSMAAATGILALGVGAVLMFPGGGTPRSVPTRSPATVPAASRPAVPTSLTSPFPRSASSVSATGARSDAGGGRPESNSALGPVASGRIAGSSGTSGSGIAGGTLGSPSATFGSPTAAGVGPGTIGAFSTAVGGAVGGVIHHVGSNGSAVPPKGRAITTTASSTIVGVQVLGTTEP